MGIGIVGLGKGGLGLVSTFLDHPKVNISAVADTDNERIRNFAKKLQVETYNNIESLCQSPNVNSVYIATPTHLHKEHIEIAARYGKHILVQKPMATTLEEADAIIAAVNRYGVTLVVCYFNGFTAPIRKIKEIVDSGELGKLRMINSWYYTDWIYRPRLPEELETKLGGGVVFRQGSHHFDIIRYLGGGKIRSLRAVTGIWDPARKAEGSYAVLFTFEDDTVATAVYSGYDHFLSHELTFGISEGGQRVDASVHAKARKQLAQSQRNGQEAEWKKQRADRFESEHNYHPFFGITVVSCEKGDIRQSPDGLLVYGDERKEEVDLDKSDSGRYAIVNEFCEAVLQGGAVIHNAGWAKANLEVSLAVISSSTHKKEIDLLHQVPIM